MGIFKVEKKDLNGNVVGIYEFPNTILDVGLEFLTSQVGADFNTAPGIGVGTSDITPDTNQHGLIAPILNTTKTKGAKIATFTPNTSTVQNPNGNKTFTASVHFQANEAIGELTEVAYAMAGINPGDGRLGSPLNRTLFQTVGALDTRFAATPELDQFQNSDISNLTKVYGSNFYSETFIPSANGTDISELALSLASSGNPAFPLNVSIYTDSTSISGTPTTLIGSTTIPAFSEPVQRWRIASFSSPLTITPGNRYHIVISCTGTDAPNAYDLFGSTGLAYSSGYLLKSADAGVTYARVSPDQNAGFKTYYSTTGAVTHDYVLTMVQFDKETAMSPDFLVSAFPENNLDSTSTTQGTVRLTLPTYVELPPFVRTLKLYKKVGSSYNLLATLNDVRQYTYDNGLVTPNASNHPPVASAITTVAGVTAIAENLYGGPLNLTQDRYYKVSSLQQGSTIPNCINGPLQENDGANTAFYTTPYSTLTLPISATMYETASSGEIHLVAPTTSPANVSEFFSNPVLDPTLWSTSTNNPDYYSIVRPASTNENQLQMNVPAGTPFVISSNRLVRANQSYYVNVTFPMTALTGPAYIIDGNGSRIQNPIYHDLAPNRIPLFGFCNPASINTFNSDKRLTLEVGLYHQYRTETQVIQGDINPFSTELAFCLYDNVGNTYFFNVGTDIPASHSDGSYTFKIDIQTDRSLQISVLHPDPDRTFRILTSTFAASLSFNFKTQYNGSHILQGGGLPGPTTQTTNHFIVPENYSFFIGNPSNDPLSYVPRGVNYISVNDSIFSGNGVPNPAFALRTTGYQGIISWTPVPGARRYRVYATQTSGNYTGGSGSLVTEYEMYFSAYGVQSTESVNQHNDFFNAIAGCGNSVRGLLDYGVTYGQDSTSTGNTNSYAIAGFIGSANGFFGGPLVPTIISTPGSAEGYQVLISNVNEFLNFTFSGGGFEVIGETGPDRGIMALYIDNNYVQDIDTYSADRLYQQTLFTTSVLTLGIHSIQLRPRANQNDFSLGSSIAIDYFHITVPAFVDTNQLLSGVPSTVTDPNVVAIPPPSIKSSRTYNGNGPTVVVKDPQHTLDVTMTFSLINPNL